MKNHLETHTVVSLFVTMSGFCSTNSKEDMNMSYNTLEANKNGVHPLKLDSILQINDGLFGEDNEYLLSLQPAELRPYLDSNHFIAYLIYQFLKEDKEWVRMVARNLLLMCDHKLPTILELAELLSEDRRAKLSPSLRAVMAKNRKRKTF